MSPKFTKLFIHWFSNGKLIIAWENPHKSNIIDQIAFLAISRLPPGLLSVKIVTLHLIDLININYY